MSIQKHGYPRELILKNGDEITLRILEPREDADNLMSFFRRVPEKDRWFLAHDVTKIDVVRGWLRNFDLNQAFPVVGVNEEGTVVACSTLHRSNHGSRAHIGRIRVVVDPNYRNQRLGTYLLLDLIQLGVDLGLSILQTEFIKGIEEKGLKAARRLDFFEQAILPDYAKDERGNTYDLAIMIKRIHRGYDDF